MAIKILASGQSNMVGVSTSNVPDFAKVSSLARFWNNVNPLGGNGSAFVSAADARTARAFTHTDRNNMVVWFADKLARTTFEAVDTVIVSRQGSPISYWNPNEVTYPLYSKIISVWSATGQGSADVFMWHQGENDVTGGTEAAYSDNFEALLANLTNAGVLSSSTVILIGAIAEQSAANSAFNNKRLLPLAKKPGRAYVSSYGLSVFDGVHFDSSSLTAFGARRYFSAYKLAMATMGAGIP